MAADLEAAGTLLRGLHLERVRRRAGKNEEELVTEQVEAKAANASPKHRFSLQEVVSCSHASHARCLQCTGRKCPEVSQSAYVTFHNAYSAVPHFSAPGAAEATALQVPRCSLAAGEILFGSFAALVADLGGGKHFLDLGSGTGRAVVAWSLLVPEGTAVGIEIRASLHQEALQVLDALPQDVSRRLHLHCGDLFEYGGLQDADVILVNSTGFDDSLMSSIGRMLRAARPGARVVTLSQPMREFNGWSLLFEALYRMTWGNCTAFVYQKSATSTGATA